MKHEMKHDLTPEVARKVAEKAFDAYRTEYASYNPVLTWKSDTRAEASFNAKGITLKGTIELLPTAIAFDLDVPFVFKLFKGKAIAIMERELKHWVGEAKAGRI
jgi:hypothetical protein